MVTLICGIPNAGKTQYSKGYEKVIHFDEVAHRRADGKFAKCNALAASAGGDVCVEGVYNSRKRRMEFLEAIKDRPEKKICIWIDTPVEVCLERECNYRNRPDSIVLTHARNFEPPTLDEGWDEIIRITGEINYGLFNK